MLRAATTCITDCDACDCFHCRIPFHDQMTAKRNYKGIKQYILSCQDLPSYFLFLITDHVHDRAFSLKVAMAEVLETIDEPNIFGKPKVPVWTGQWCSQNHDSFLLLHNLLPLPVPSLCPPCALLCPLAPHCHSSTSLPSPLS